MCVCVCVYLFVSECMFMCVCVFLVWGDVQFCWDYVVCVCTTSTIYICTNITWWFTFISIIYNYVVLVYIYIYVNYVCIMQCLCSWLSVHVWVCVCARYTVICLNIQILLKLVEKFPMFSVSYHIMCVCVSVDSSLTDRTEFEWELSACVRFLLLFWLRLGDSEWRWCDFGW